MILSFWLLILLSIHSIAFLIAAISAPIFVVIPSIGYDNFNFLPLFGGQIITPAPPYPGLCGQLPSVNITIVCDPSINVVKTSL